MHRHYFAGGPFGIIDVGRWQGAAYTNDKGAFSYCIAAAKFPNGGLVLFQNADHSWLIGFLNSDWNLSERSLPIILTFDGHAQFEVVASAREKTVVAPLSKEALGALRKARLLVATGSKRTIQFDLAAAGNVVPTIENCVNTMNAKGIAAAGDFSKSSDSKSSDSKSSVPKSSAPNSKPPAAKASAKSDDDVTETPRRGEVTGTGFVVSKSAQIVTNNHVVKDCVGDIHGNIVGQASVKLRIVSADETNDLALLQGTKKFKEKDIATIRASAVNSGDQVVAIGYPLHGLLTSDLTVTTGVISSLAGLYNDTRFLQISAPVQPGNSGGPLHDASGNVVGVVTAKLNALRIAKATGDIPENINFAIKTGALRDFLDNSAVSYSTAEPGSEMKTADIASAARTYTMLISCTAEIKNERK
ncbi:MAG TPA: S1C family serine protease [Xanthobacteraceae bacterium]|nr:S1C family serine protease [Xanthobacteraceae bacterium]